MKVKAKYKHLNDNEKVYGIGSLFRGADRQRWSIYLVCSGDTLKSVNFSAAPILARYRTLNPTKYYKRAGRSFSFIIDDTRNWGVVRISDCPAWANKPKGKDARQYCFVTNVDGKVIYIPQFELARVLFYHDPYMSRLSLQHNALSEDFYIQKTDETTEVHVLSEAEYPLSYYNKDENLRFLTWVLLDKDARKSFESISANMIVNSYILGSYMIWDFQFDPPPLKNVELKVSGWHDYESNSFFVWEIWSVSNLPSSITGEVNFNNPKYKRNVGGKPDKDGSPTGEMPEEYELDDDEKTDQDKSPIQIVSEPVIIAFDKPFIANRVSKEYKIVKHLTGDKEKDASNNDLSVNEKEDTGKLREGSWNNLDDQTDDSELLQGKFNTFLAMVNKLESKHGCKIVNKTIEKLPKVCASKKHFLSDGLTLRGLAIVELIYNNQHITLLEIDTSDGAAKVSTMMLRTNATGWLKTNLDKVKAGIVKKSLGWPTELFKKGIGDKEFFGIPHPKSKKEGLLDKNEIEPWAQRFINWICR